MNELCVIVINYLAPDTTRRCLDSLRSEAFDTLHVIDNSADPEANQAFLRMIASFEDEPPPWELIVSVNDENLGFGRAINRAIQADRSPIAAPTNTGPTPKSRGTTAATIPPTAAAERIAIWWRPCLTQSTSSRGQLGSKKIVVATSANHGNIPMSNNRELVR